MRDIVFLVADNECAAALRGLLEAPHCHLKLGCERPINFDSRQDLLVHPEKDPGVFTRGEVLLATKRATHRHAVVILDAAWNGSPGTAQIRAEIKGRVLGIPWDPKCFEVVCIAPELETWVWQDHVLVEQAFKVRDCNLRQWLAGVADERNRRPVSANLDGGLPALWPVGMSKPPDPKKAVEVTRRVFGGGPPSGIFAEITSRISLAGCQDQAFGTLRAALRRWFRSPANTP